MTNKQKIQCLWIFNSDPVVDLFLKEINASPLSKQIDLHTIKSKDSEDGSNKIAAHASQFIFIDDQIPIKSDITVQKLIESCAGGDKERIAIFADQKNVNNFKHEKIAKVFAKPLNMADIISWMASSLSLNNETSSGAKPEVDVRVINSIIQASIKVVSQFGLKDVKMEKAKPRKADEVLPGIISSYIEIKSAKFNGLMILSFEKACYLGLVGSMLGEEQKELNADNQDAAGEINNIIYGNAKSDFTSYGIELTIPKIVVGDAIKLPSPAGSSSIEVPISTQCGRFFVDVIAFPKAS